jgi:hypothetical protein
MRFQFFPLRFEFIARESLHFPPGKAANILRGALGIIFQGIACRPECRDARLCDIRHTCSYARVFEPTSQGVGPSGLSYWPRPFVFRARHLDGRTIQTGEPFHFDLHVFSLDPAVLADFILTFAALASEGIGPRRGKAELQRVQRLPLGNQHEQFLYRGSMPIATVEPASLDLEPAASAHTRIRVEFLSPTELKHDHKISSRPEFPILFGRIRDRVSTLRALYGPGPLDIDFRGMRARAARVRMTNCDVRREEADRRSTRTGQSHSIGGFVGVAEYEGEMSEFLPYLEACRWVGVGRQAVWGKGEIAIATATVGEAGVSWHEY